MIFFENDADPAMRYEGLARAAFNNCNKFGDPFQIAAQELYSHYVPKPSVEGKRNLSIILSKLVFDYPEFRDKLIDIEERVWESDNQSQIIEIIDESIELLNKIFNR